MKLEDLKISKKMGVAIEQIHQDNMRRYSKLSSEHQPDDEMFTVVLMIMVFDLLAIADTFRVKDLSGFLTEFVSVAILAHEKAKGTKMKAFYNGDEVPGKEGMN